MVLVFLSSALMKAVDYENTVNLFQVMTEFPERIIQVLVVILITLEIIITSLFYLNLHITFFAKYFIAMLLCSFIIVGVFLAITGNDNCGCFGTFVSIRPGQSIVKNISLLVLFIIMVRKTRRTINA
jgi:hypothetical protein